MFHTVTWKHFDRYLYQWRCTLNNKVLNCVPSKKTSSWQESLSSSFRPFLPGRPSTGNGQFSGSQVHLSIEVDTISYRWQRSQVLLSPPGLPALTCPTSCVISFPHRPRPFRTFRLVFLPVGVSSCHSTIDLCPEVGDSLPGCSRSVLGSSLKPLDLSPL